jgi:hypothetical protein
MNIILVVNGMRSMIPVLPLIVIMGGVPLHSIFLNTPALLSLNKYYYFSANYLLSWAFELQYFSTFRTAKDYSTNCFFTFLNIKMVVSSYSCQISQFYCIVNPACYDALYEGDPKLKSMFYPL